MRRNHVLAQIILAALALLVVPLRSDGGPECDTATTSLQDTRNNPVAGDQKFFMLPVGPSNVVLLVDYSTSMLALPQCGDGIYGGWASGDSLSCQWPTSWGTIPDPAVGTVTTDSGCDMTRAGFSNIKWMANYKPTATYADPGRGVASNGLVDQPTWGTGCTGNNCLFDSTKLYDYMDWTDTTATPRTSDPCTQTVSWQDQSCVAGNPRNPSTTNRSATIVLPNCSSCLTGTNAAGFYFWHSWKYGIAKRTATVTSTGSGSHKVYTCTNGTTNTYASGGGTNNVVFSGGWLNANPPKVISARKVIKDVAWIDPAGTTWKTDNLRLAFAMFPSGDSNSAALLVPLGPSKADSYPGDPAAYIKARQVVLDAVNLKNYPSGATKASVSGSTPAASALFRVGQYLSKAGTYNKTENFGSGWEVPEFSEGTRGEMGSTNVTWTNTESICWKCQKSGIILVTDGSPNSEMTFPSKIGTYPPAVPPATLSAYYDTQNCGNVTSTACTGSPTSACCSPSDTSHGPSKLPRVAAWLHETDLTDRYSNDPEAQTAATSTVSFGLPDGSNAQRILRATANMGGGTFNNASDGQALAAAVAQAIQQVSTASTSFSAPAATALTTINAVDTKAFVTRFKPATDRDTWEGHVFEWMLFDEAAAGCDPTKKPDASDDSQFLLCGRSARRLARNFNGDTDRDGFNVCNGSFLVDADCYEVEENQDTGKWFQKRVGGTEAAYFWDAGKALSFPGTAGYRTAAEHNDTGNIAPLSQYAPDDDAVPRNLWTALPDGTMVELETKNAGTLAPYMSLTSDWCSRMEEDAKLCGGTTGVTCPKKTGTDWQTPCAQQLILFLRGWDVMDHDGDGCAGPGNPSNGTNNSVASIAADGTVTAATKPCAIRSTGTYSGEERDRPNDAGYAKTTPAPSFYKLGDIFHSSPVLVHPPSSEAMCRLGTENQCVRTLYGYTSSPKYGTGYQTELATYSGSSLSTNGYSCTVPTGTVDAYRAWRNAYATRENVTLVGSNDGFLHAFDAGGPDASTGKPDLDCVMPNVKDGNGEELWGFMPIDVLAKLKSPMVGDGHEYTVDGNIMVRDVWVDGATADTNPGNPQPGTGNSLDGKKQKNEFRTIAIFGERAGGTQFTALDVTNAFSTTAADRPRPTWKWAFPQPRSDDAQYMGQSWSDFSPRPPPVGPVRLKAEAGDQATGAWVPDPDAAPTATEKFVEKWVVMLNGGYDPTLNRGRAVWMVDVWTGGVVWRFTDSDFQDKAKSDAANAGMFPVAAGVAMIDLGRPCYVGENSKACTTGLDSDNFFDTATWGDLGGNLWVARFDTPGVKSGGRVTNWRAARAFEQGRTANGSQYATNRTEFFYMTSNAFEAQKRTLRTMIGSGNREQILETGAGCGPDNLFSCCQASCTVKATSSMNYGDCSSTGEFDCAGGLMTSAKLVDGCSAGSTQCGTPTAFTSSSGYELTCGSDPKVTANGSASCDASGVCTITEVGDTHDIALADSGTCSNKARFYGIWTYGGAEAKTMSTASSLTNWDGAKTFDKNRFTDVPQFGSTDDDICTFIPADTVTHKHYCSLVETTQAKVTASNALSCLDGGDKCQATIDDPGWFYTYDVVCPTVSDAAVCALNTAGTGLKCTSEKTASGATVVNSCASWNGFVPMGSAATPTAGDPCSGASTSKQTAIGYSSNYVSGTPDTTCNQGGDVDKNVVYRGATRSTIAPPAAPMVRMGISQTGQVYYSTLQLDPGAPATSSAQGSRDVASTLYWLEVGRRDHACRHVSGTNCD